MKKFFLAALLAATLNCGVPAFADLAEGEVPDQVPLPAVGAPQEPPAAPASVPVRREQAPAYADAGPLTERPVRQEQASAPVLSVQTGSKTYAQIRYERLGSSRHVRRYTHHEVRVARDRARTLRGRARTASLSAAATRTRVASLQSQIADINRQMGTVVAIRLKKLYGGMRKDLERQLAEAQSANATAVQAEMTARTAADDAERDARVKADNELGKRIDALGQRVDDLSTKVEDQETRLGHVETEQGKQAKAFETVELREKHLGESVKNLFARSGWAGLFWRHLMIDGMSDLLWFAIFTGIGLLVFARSGHPRAGAVVVKTVLMALVAISALLVLLVLIARAMSA